MAPVETTTNNGAQVKAIAPHGGQLVCRAAGDAAAREILDRFDRLPRVPVNPRQLSDLEMIAVGAFSPLEGFMNEADYWNVLHHMRLASWLPWSLPVTLAVDRSLADSLSVGSEVGLTADDGTPVGVLELAEKYRYDRRQEARLVYRTEEDAHPGVAAVYAQGEVLLAGKVTAFDRRRSAEFADLRLAPADTRRAFAERGWRRVVGFQTRNPIHRAHEYLQKCALEIADGLLIHPLVGATKDDDIPAEVRLQCYRELLDGYFPHDRVLLSVLPAAMRYAGPREAIFHAIVRKNYGCTHFIVGRDHAGVGSYYGTYDAQRIFDEFEDGELGITPLFYDHAFYCRRCGTMATTKTCPHGDDDRIALSGTRVRAMLQNGELPPPEFTRPEVARILVEAAQAAGESG
jgi:sulfate adenylyltransferase